MQAFIAILKTFFKNIFQTFLAEFAVKATDWFKTLRFRHISMILGVIISLVFAFAADPDVPALFTVPFGAKALLFIKIIFLLSVAAFIAHFIRKTLFDYIDLQTVINKAIEHPIGAGLAIIGVSLMVLSAGAIFIALAILM